MRYRAENFDFGVVQGSIVMESHDSSHISPSVAVIGGTEHRHTSASVLDFNPVIGHFVRSYDEIQAIFNEEMLGHILTEGIACSTGTDTKSGVLLWICN
jgi:hypothetical protein